MSNVNVTSVSLDKSKLVAAAQALKGEADVLGQLEADPKAFLAKFGVGVDDATAQSIRQRIAGRSQATPGAVVHIDLPG